MRATTILVTALALGAANCAPQAPPVDIAAETEALRDTAERYNAAVEALDAAGVAAFYAQDCRAMPPNEATLVGPAAFETFLQEFAAIEGVAVDLDSPEVVVAAGGGLGYTVGPVRVTAPGQGGELETVEERDVHVWRKEPDGSWKLVIDIWSSPTPAVEPEE